MKIIIKAKLKKKKFISRLFSNRGETALLQYGDVLENTVELTK